jgi:hypothetical protein
MAELALGVIGVVGTIDVCIKWGKALVTACKDFHGAESGLDEMLVRVELCWSRIANQLDVTRELDETMSADDRDLQEHVLSILEGKLVIAARKLSKFVVRPVLSVIGKLKYAILKRALSETIAELETWQRLYEPSWFHLIKLAPPKIEVTLLQIVQQGSVETTQQHKVAKNFRKALSEQPKLQEKSLAATTTANSVWIQSTSLSVCQIYEIPFCAATFAKRPESDKHLIIDPVTTDAVQESDAVDFAMRLKNADPFVFGLLSCKGVRRKHGKHPMSFIFNVPNDYTVVWGLRQLLLGNTHHDSLTGRLEIARSLVTAVYYIHLYGFVHKNIRPETILSLARPGETGLPSKAFLTGFQVIRNADGATYAVSDSGGWEKNLYRHPLRQGVKIDYYIMQHDIYSLGVCLLEIGLWSSFVTYGPHWVAQPSPALALSRDRTELKDPVALKDHLLTLSRGSALRSVMGTRYGEIVETCLTCLDEDNVDFEDEKDLTDEGSANVGMRYIVKVLEIMNTISI